MQILILSPIIKIAIVGIKSEIFSCVTRLRDLLKPGGRKKSYKNFQLKKFEISKFHCIINWENFKNSQKNFYLFVEVNYASIMIH